MQYFVMTCEGVYPSAALGRGPALDDAPWFHGGRLRGIVPEPLVYQLNPRRPGTCAPVPWSRPTP